MFKVKNIAVLFTVLAALGLSGDVWGMNESEIIEIYTKSDLGWLNLIGYKQEDRFTKNKLQALYKHYGITTNDATSIKRSGNRVFIPFNRIGTDKTFENFGFALFFKAEPSFDKLEPLGDMAPTAPQIDTNNEIELNYVQQTETKQEIIPTSSKFEDKQIEQKKNGQLTSTISTITYSALASLFGLVWGTVQSYLDTAKKSRDYRIATGLGTGGLTCITTGLCMNGKIAGKPANNAWVIGCAAASTWLGSRCGKPVVNATCTMVKKLFLQGASVFIKSVAKQC